jgi:hypothetical protein
MDSEKPQEKIIIDREQLKEYFKNGKLPTEIHFGMLIDSMLHKKDDGLSINDMDALMVFPTIDKQKLLSFYENKNDKNASWVIVNSQGERKGLIIKEEKNEFPAIFFERGGNIGIGTPIPHQKLDVEGFIASKGRVGTFPGSGEEILADGKWHTLIKDLSGCEAFEIMAYAGVEGKGKYALLHAIAISTFGNSRSKISKTCAHYGFWWNKITLRWTGETKNFSLQIKTKSHFGEGVKIHFKISKLWDKSFIK